MYEQVERPTPVPRSRRQRVLASLRAGIAGTARLGRPVALAVALCVVSGLVVLAPGTAQATQIRNTTPWSVLLCKFKDKTAEPQTPAFFRNLVTDAGLGMGGIADYFRDQSGGRISLAGSVVMGWYTESYTHAQDLALGNDRGTRIQHCVDAAATGGYTVPAGNRTMVVLNEPTDAGSAGPRVLLNPGSFDVGFVAHEMLHSYGLDHSYSNDTTFRAAPWSQPGEYDDPWDQMSAMAIFSFTTANFGTSAVGLNGPQRDELGWLGRSRVFTMGWDGVGSRTIGLAPLEVPAAAGIQLVRIPFSPGDLFNYYTVEYRRKTGWSNAIPADTVLIHEVRNGTPYLLRGANRAPVQSLNANGVQISVGSVGGNAATVTINTDIVVRCLSGWVWRVARASDLVCSTPQTRADVAADNLAAPSRWVNGAYGPHTCVSGYVWREAFAGDDVCVIPARRTLAWDDNAAAASRRNPARFVTGPNTCVSGYVWREAYDADYACVTPATRSQVAADNSVAASRWVNGAYGPHTCVSGYVWREAFLGDDVCVVPAQRSQAVADNAAASGRVLRPAG